MRQILETLVFNWPQIYGVDYNLIDVYWFGKFLSDVQDIKPKTFEIDEENGLVLVDIIDRNFIEGELLRDRDPNDLVSRINDAYEELRKIAALSNLPDNEKLVISLFLWHGCMYMADIIKKKIDTEEGEKEFTHEERLQEYEFIKGFLKDNNGENFWISQGVKLSKQFLIEKNFEVIDEWVPKESPYWDQ